MGVPRAIRYTVQYCADGRDITGDFYADQDADTVRFWEAGGDPFCLLEVTKESDGYGRAAWVPSGSDADYTLIAGERFASLADALQAQLPASSGYRLVEETQ